MVHMGVVGLGWWPRKRRWAALEGGVEAPTSVGCSEVLSPPRRTSSASSPLPTSATPPCREPFTAEGWLFELKHDGFRAFVRKSGADVHLLSRWGRSMGNAFPEVIDALAERARTFSHVYV